MVRILKIRKSQMKAFQAYTRIRFEDRLITYLESCFPDLFQGKDTGTIRKAVRHGIDRAEEHAMLEERDICRFVALMCVFGRDFDGNPELPKAAKILNDPNHSAAWKLEQLYEQLGDPPDTQLPFMHETAPETHGAETITEGDNNHARP